MSLFDRTSEKDSHRFPTEPAFLVPVEVRDVPEHGRGQRGVFAAAPIAANTKFWVWTDRVEKIHHKELDAYIATKFGEDQEKIGVFSRQGFVLPGEGKEDYFYSNPTDAGRFMNHSSKANCGPDGTLRDVSEGEELTMDYSFHGDPQWYRDICRRHGVQTEAEVARRYP